MLLACVCPSHLEVKHCSLTKVVYKQLKAIDIFFTALEGNQSMQFSVIFITSPFHSQSSFFLHFHSIVYFLFFTFFIVILL